MCNFTLVIQADERQTRANLRDDRGQDSGIVRIPNGEAESTFELLQQLYLRTRSEYGGFLDTTAQEKIAVVALPGLETPELFQAAHHTVQRALGVNWSICLCESLAPEMVGALGGAPGLLVSSDIDASVACLDKEGTFSTLQHNPDSLGREGSGLWLGTRLLQVAARMAEGRLEHSPKLEEALKEHFSVKTLTQLFHQLEQSSPTPESMMKLGQLVVELAEFPDPDPASRALVTRTSRRLTELVKDCLFEKDVKLASWSGRIMTGTFLEEVQNGVSELDWRSPEKTWLEGAWHISKAFRHLGEGKSEPVHLWRKVTEMRSELS